MKYLLYIFIIAYIFILAPIKTSAMEKESFSAAVLAGSVPQTDSRIDTLTSYFRKMNPEMVPFAEHFIREADRFGLDWTLLPAITGVESTFCKHIPNGSFNCWGWGIPTGSSYGIGFTSYSEGITTVIQGLKERYVGRGLLSVEQIGRVYAASPTWSVRVNYFMDQIKNHSENSTHTLLALQLAQ